MQSTARLASARSPLSNLNRKRQFHALAQHSAYEIARALEAKDIKVKSRFGGIRNGETVMTCSKFHLTFRAPAGNKSGEMQMVVKKSDHHWSKEHTISTNTPVEGLLALVKRVAKK